MTDKPKGMLVGIYRDGIGNTSDTTNGGVTGLDRGARDAIAIHGDLPDLFEVKMETPGLEIITGPGGNLIAVPLVFMDDEVGPMFGGNFIWTSDSRFRKLSPGPIPVHDRFETPDNYATYD